MWSRIVSDTSLLSVKRMSKILKLISYILHISPHPLGYLLPITILYITECLQSVELKCRNEETIAGRISPIPPIRGRRLEDLSLEKENGSRAVAETLRSGIPQQKNWLSSQWCSVDASVTSSHLCPQNFQSCSFTWGG